MATNKLRFLAVFVCTILMACQSQPASQGPGGKESTDALTFMTCTTAVCTCNANVCRIPVDVSTCAATGIPNIVTTMLKVQTIPGNPDPRIVWVIMPLASPYVFHRGTGVVLKNPNADPTGQFYQKYVADAGDKPVPSQPTGKRYHWRNQNVLTEINSYDYEVNVYTDDAQQTRCHKDPTIHNQG